MSLQSNLAMAWFAVTFVRKLAIQANNDSIVDRLTDQEWQTLTMRLDVNVPGSVRNQFLQFCQSPDWDACFQQRPDAIAKLAELSRQLRVGNCTEKSSIAIAFLMNARVRPLDLMNLMPNHNLDHVFVVIGRKANSIDPTWATLPQSHVDGSVDSDTSTWGPEAVVCDPWHDQGKAYPAYELDTQMYRGWQTKIAGPLKPVSIWRTE